MTPDEQTISEILAIAFHEDRIRMVKKYAKDQSIAFAEWVDRECYRQTIGKNPVWIGENMQGYSTEQLYEKFLQQQLLK